MTLTQMRYIVALAATEHFGQAATECFVSQPTLSVAIKKLEQELQVAIFERRKNGVSPTDIGKRIIAQANVTLQQASVIKELANIDKDQLNSPLKVGAIHTIGPYLYPQLVHKVRAIAPQMPLYIEENFTAKLREKLVQGELDAIIIALPFSEADVVTRALYNEDFLVLVHSEHEWSSKSKIAAQSLVQTELLLLGEGHCFRDQILESCGSLKQALNQEHKTTQGSSLETIRLMVASGLGSSVLPKSAVQSIRPADNVKVIPFTEPVPGRSVALAWRASFARTKAIDCLIQAIRSCEMDADDKND